MANVIEDLFDAFDEQDNETEIIQLPKKSDLSLK